MDDDFFQKSSTQTYFAPACPTPTKSTQLSLIAEEISTAISKGVPIDVVTTEWERLHTASKACRGQK